MARDFKRTDRVAQALQRELAALIHAELKDPRIGLITLSGAQVSRDLSHAKIFFTTLQDDPAQRQEIAHALNHAAGFLRHAVGQRIRMRIVPTLHFVYDESVARGAYMSALIEQAIASDHPPTDSLDSVDSVDGDD